MKTIITSAKRILCNVLLFLTTVELIISVVNHHFYGKPYPHLFIIMICLVVATYASLQRKKYSK